MTVMLDGGIRRGTRRGSSAGAFRQVVFIGRPLLYAPVIGRGPCSAR